MPRRAKQHIYLRGTVWWCWFYDHAGKRVHHSTHQRDEALARSAARRLEREHLETPARPAVAPLDESLAMWLASVERKGRAADTQEYYVKKAKRLVEYFGTRDINSLTLADVEAYIDYRLDKKARLPGSPRRSRR